MIKTDVSGSAARVVVKEIAANQQQQQWEESNMAAKRLAACLLNISEGRNQGIVRDIASAAVKNQQKWVPDSLFSHQPTSQLEAGVGSNYKCNATVLNIFQDFEYNRSVITLAAPIEFLGTCIFQACIEAFKRIDLRHQDGRHPRLGAVDLIPIHPLSSAVSLDECGAVARNVGKDIVEKIPLTSVFFFGNADAAERRGLVSRRKEMKWYQGRKGYSSMSGDIGGQPTERYGLTGVGSMPYMTNFNVTINTSSMSIGNSIAKEIRGSSPNGLFGVQSMAFPHMGMIEVACNVETADLQKIVCASFLVMLSLVFLHILSFIRHSVLGITSLQMCV